MKYPKIPLAQTVVTLCKAKEIKHIVISPGSRNAPLTIGFTNDDFFNCYSIVDERSAAFFALGIAQKIKSPVALVCTSGSALLNYYPAIAEAFYSDIPLIVLSADRPKYLVGIGDGQTINQNEVFKNHILYSSNLKLDLDLENKTNEEELPIFKSIENKLEKLLGLQLSIQESNEVEINKTINTSIVKNGPVHINVPFKEPLYELVDSPSVNPKVVEPEINSQKTNPEDLKGLVNIWNSASKKMVLVGVKQPNEIEQQWLELLANDPSVLIFTETTSNLHHESIFPSIDKIIAPLTKLDFEQLQPDVLLTIGGMVVSKKIKAFLRTYKPKYHWHLDEKKAFDTYFCLSNHLKGNPNTFLSQFLPEISHSSGDYRKKWERVKTYRKERHQYYLKSIPFSDLKVFETVLDSLPENSVLQVGNSSAIRYTQLFDLKPSLKVFCNRGTSGIDGSTSTAIGYASASSEQTIFITGDLSFFYDSNALWNNYIPSNFRIILVNNGGGGIFRILPGNKDSENFDKYFETKHQLNAEQLCKMFQFDYDKVQNDASLKESLKEFYKLGPKPKLLEIETPSKLNDKVLMDYFKNLA